MRVLFAFNAFKGCLTAIEACEAAAEVCAAMGHEVRLCPVADGGDGTAAVISRALQCSIVNVGVVDPIGRSQIARYGWHYETRTAVMEMASASGLALLRETDRDVMRATSLGTGQMIAHAITQKRARKILIGLGGSATVDGGIGAVQALGWKFADREGQMMKLGLGGSDLKNISVAYVPTGPDALTQGVEIWLLCDVRNPLLGPHGAAPVFGPQKGASFSQVEDLEEGLRHWIISVIRRPDVAVLPGSGAAGGLAAGLIACCGARFCDGARTVSQVVGLSDAVQWADLVITGEGCLDEQTLMGKAPAEVARAVREQGKSLGVICGKIDMTDEELKELGDVIHVAQTAPPDMPVAEAMANAKVLLKKTVRGMFQCDVF